jgi:dTDP-4-dehydrorhamnose 3,5-epimerase
MKVTECPISDLLIIEPIIHKDSRGFFLETWNRNEFEKIGIATQFVQDNFSHSMKGTLRGLHYQIKKPQDRLVIVSQGEIFDVAIDLRVNSKSFGKWFSVKLSAKNRKMLWIPKGFAHGFYVLSNTADVQYKCTEFYAPELEQCIIWNDPTLSIAWPIESNPIISQKDSNGNFFSDAILFGKS